MLEKVITKVVSSLFFCNKQYFRWRQEVISACSRHAAVCTTSFERAGIFLSIYLENITWHSNWTRDLGSSDQLKAQVKAEWTKRRCMALDWKSFVCVVSLYIARSKTYAFSWFKYRELRQLPRYSKEKSNNLLVYAHKLPILD